MRRTLLVLAAAGLLAVVACGGRDSTPVAVTIRRGANFPEAADSLAAHGIIRSPRLFAIYAARVGRDRRIRYGTYVLERGSSWNSVLTALESGRGIVNRVRVVEGWAAWDIVPALATALTVPEDSVTAAVRDTAFLRRVGVPRGTISLEGYLFPDTYFFPEGVTARQAVELMLRNFERTWRPEWTPRLAELKMTRHQIVTLASIIEKEVRKGEERPLVSAVYHNRLKISMPLQADPTIQFALGRRRPTRVFYRDLRVNSPYNTYRRVGLPRQAKVIRTEIVGPVRCGAGVKEVNHVTAAQRDPEILHQLPFDKRTDTQVLVVVTGGIVIIGQRTTGLQTGARDGANVVGHPTEELFRRA
jgi:UPF0755 protein